MKALQEITKAEKDGYGGTLSESNSFMTDLANTDVQLQALKALEARVVASVEETGAPGDEASMLKIVGTQVQQTLESLRVEAVGNYSLPFETDLIRGESNLPAPGPDYAVSAVSDMNFGRASSIYGGSNEIQRMVIAKAVLGL